MRNLSRNRRMAIVLAASAAILPGSAALLSQTQISSFSHGHEFLNGLVLGLSMTLIAGSLIFLKRDRSACSRSQTPGV